MLIVYMVYYAFRLVCLFLLFYFFFTILFLLVTTKNAKLLFFLFLLLCFSRFSMKTFFNVIFFFNFFSVLVCTVQTRLFLEHKNTQKNMYFVAVAICDCCMCLCAVGVCHTARTKFSCYKNSSEWNWCNGKLHINICSSIRFRKD